MGFYPRIRLAFRDVCQVVDGMMTYNEIRFYKKDSFKNFVDMSLTSYNKQFLNEDFIKCHYFFWSLGSRYFEEKEVEELISLFFSYLRDKKILRNIRIDRG